MNRLQRYFSDIWAMRRQDCENSMALLLPSIMRGELSQVETWLGTQKVSMNAVSAMNAADWWDVSDPELPEDTVAVITLGGSLYSWETDWLMECVREAVENEKIAGIVLAIDGPGGMVSHVDQAVALIRDCNKPTATVVGGLMASAHFWIGTATDRTFAASPLCEVGSVGVYMPYMGMQKYFKKAGIDMRDIYPDTADLKNHAYRALEEKGDDSEIKEKLERTHRAFAEDVAKNLGIEYEPDKEIFRGATFLADEAVKLGYVDQMGSVEDAIKWVLGKATSAKAANMYN